MKIGAALLALAFAAGACQDPGRSAATSTAPRERGREAAGEMKDPLAPEVRSEPQEGRPVVAPPRDIPTAAFYDASGVRTAPLLFAQWWRRGDVFEKKPDPNVHWVSGGSIREGQVEVSLHDVRLPSRAEFYVFEDPGATGRPGTRIKTVTCDMYDPDRITGCRYEPATFDIEPSASVTFTASVGERTEPVGIVFFAAWGVPAGAQRRRGIRLNELAASWFFRAGP